MNMQHDESVCELLNGQTCEALTELRRLKEELQITREFIHDHGLEWALLSYYKKKEAHS
jgi:hypothetical protein